MVDQTDDLSTDLGCVTLLSPQRLSPQIRQLSGLRPEAHLISTYMETIGTHRENLVLLCIVLGHALSSLPACL